MALKKIDTVLIKRKTGTDLFAQDIYDNEESIAARWNDEVKFVKDEDGIDFQSVSSIYYDNEVSLSIGDSAKLDVSTDIFRPIQAIAKYRNGSGTKFFNIAYLGNNVR